MGTAGPSVELIGKVWRSLEETGSYRYVDGPLVIELPWPPETAASEPVA
jgi:hypothetical protein